MPRHFDNWLNAYTDFTAALEAPLNIHFFSGVSAIAGVLRRHVWFDQGMFKWFPNFYIIVVARPGIVNKSTSIGVAMDLLREVPGVHMGPSSITWQGLVMSMGGVTEQVEIGEDLHTQSCLTFAASELGTLIDFRNREMIDVLVDLWDGKTGSWEKMTKMSGTEAIVNPWINVIAGTTPAWLQANVPESAIGGGFTSRCIFVYGSAKRYLVAYPKKHLPKEHFEIRDRLIADLEHMSMLRGEYVLTPEAEEYGQEWYVKLWTETPEHLRDARFEGYVTRKQTHLHKLMMIIAASQRDEMILTKEDFIRAETMLASAEDDMLLVFNNIGRHEASLTMDELVDFLEKKGGVPQSEIYRLLARRGDFTFIQNMVNLAITSDLVHTKQVGNDLVYCATHRP